MSRQLKEEALHEFAENVRYLWAAPIRVYEEPPPPHIFLREHVALSRPCIIRRAILNRNGEPLCLGLDDLIQVDPTLLLNVDVTPDGHGDCPRCVVSDNGTTSLRFVRPQTISMRIHHFADFLRSEKCMGNSRQEMASRAFPLVAPQSRCANCTPPHEQCVVYYSRQNDCLRSELKPLVDLFPPTIPLAAEAFNAAPDAVNLWIGNERSSSSMHKDPYENLFYVLDGQKRFTLCPPGDAPFLYERVLACADFQYQEDESRWLALESSESTPWIVSYVLDSSDTGTLATYPDLVHTHPVSVDVNAGDLLYLPALWYHSVTQTRETVAINYWYDMRFESPTWIYYRLLERLESE